MGETRVGVICDRRIAARVKEKICKRLARPAVMNGLETVALTKTVEVELEAVELKMLRFSVRVTRGLTVKQDIGLSR